MLYETIIVVEPTLSALIKMIAFPSLLVSLTTCGESVTMFSDGISVISFGSIPIYGFPFLSVIVITRLVVFPIAIFFENDGTMLTV